MLTSSRCSPLAVTDDIHKKAKCRKSVEIPLEKRKQEKHLLSLGSDTAERRKKVPPSKRNHSLFDTKLKKQENKLSSRQPEQQKKSSLSAICH
jgi:hypothetical protein